LTRASDGICIATGYKRAFCIDTWYNKADLPLKLALSQRIYCLSSY
jgi:hypothetical protein